MPAARPYRRLSEAVRHRLDVATAMAWEALVETHVAQTLEFVSLFEDRLPLEDALTRYIRELDMSETMGAAVRTRALVSLEDHAQKPDDAAVDIGAAGSADEATAADDDEGWKRFKPGAVMRGVLERQRKHEEIERMVELAIARAEEEVIKTHVDNAITFAALLEDSGALSRGVEQYIASLNVVGGRGQAVLQRTMARLADVHLPRKA